MSLTPIVPGDGHGEQFPQSDCTLSCGDLAPDSGLYEVCHSDEPRVPAVFMKGEKFPGCQRCGHAVRYKLVRVVPHISEDRDF